MEFWLCSYDSTEKLRLPVIPEQFTVTQGSDVKVININAVGELSLIGKKKLRTISLETFFPATAYPYCQYTDFPKPYACVDLITKWQDAQKPIRLIITETNINTTFAISNFTYGEKPGGHDVNFTLELTENRPPVTTAANSSSSATTNRPVTKTPDTTYTVKKGDTLSAIAKMAYGDAAKYKVIAEKNNIINPDKINTGQVLLL